MTTTLCAQCFPGFGSVEVLTIIPMTPCEDCGATDDRYNGGPRVHLLRSDPRNEAERQLGAVMRDVDAYAVALLTCRLHQNQENRREVERTRKALQKVVSNLLMAAKEQVK